MRGRPPRQRAIPETPRYRGRTQRRSQHAAFLADLGRRTWQRRGVTRPGLDATAIRTVLSHLWGGRRRAGTARSDPDRALLQADGRAAATSVAACAGRHGTPARHLALLALFGAYGGDTYRLLTDLADLLGAGVAYVDRPTVEAHLERDLSDREWTAVRDQFTAMAFDDHVGDADNLRTDWIEDVLARAGVPGCHACASDLADEQAGAAPCRGRR